MDPRDRRHTLRQSHSPKPNSSLFKLPALDYSVPYDKLERSLTMRNGGNKEKNLRDKRNLSKEKHELIREKHKLYKEELRA